MDGLGGCGMFFYLLPSNEFVVEMNRLGVSRLYESFMLIISFRRFTTAKMS